MKIIYTLEAKHAPQSSFLESSPSYYMSLKRTDHKPCNKITGLVSTVTHQNELIRLTPKTLLGLYLHLSAPLSGEVKSFLYPANSNSYPCHKSWRVLGHFESFEMGDCGWWLTWGSISILIIYAIASSSCWQFWDYDEGGLCRGCWRGNLMTAASL